MRVFEAKKKFTTVMKKDNEKTGNEIKNVSVCIRQKLSGFDIVSIEYSGKQQIKFIPIVIIYKPVKNGTA